VSASAAAGAAVAAGVVARVERLVGALRAAGAPVRPADVVDAMAAVGAVDLGRRAELRVALATTLVKDERHLAAFGLLFDACFPGGAGLARPPSPRGSLRDRVVEALARGDPSPAELTALARDAEGPSYQRALRALAAGSLAQDALRSARQAGRPVSAAATTAAVDRFLRALRGELLARRLVAGAGAEGDITALVPPDPLELDIAGASAVERAELRALLQPLARRLAARLHHARRDRQGTLDMRRTLRRSIAAGGVPLDPAWRRRRPRRPDLWLLCDVSGSVAEYARFTVGLAAAAHDEIPRLRAFVFVDELVEVTPTLAGRRHEVDAFALVGGAAVGLAGRRSDWGRALRAFEDRHAGSLGPRSTVVVTGDGRSHGADPAADVVARLCRRARSVTMLVPEPPALWSTTDSALPAYAAAGATLHETRTLAQLSLALEALAR
jgi:uncharacterized protein with von Willebrand factor type A (vWA) domain